VQIAAANPNRVGLLIFITGGLAAITVSTKPTFAGNAGMNVPNQGLQFFHHEVGPLTTFAWFGQGQGLAGPVTVIEIVLDHWPAEGG
jgi:hypothetical protein